MKPTEYLKNATILKAIHASKKTYTYYLDAKYSDYDVISKAEDITAEFLSELSELEGDQEDRRVVYRVMTWEHVPSYEAVKGGPKQSRADGGEGRIQINFAPFKHYILQDGVLTEVARSHWVGGFENGHFSQDHGKMTNSLAHIITLLVTRYGTRYNWRGYSFNDDMRGNAIVQLCQVGLSFNEAKGQNPFAYYTQIADNAFKAVLKKEAQQSDIKDEHMLMAGMMPSSKYWAGDLGKYTQDAPIPHPTS